MKNRGFPRGFVVSVPVDRTGFIVSADSAAAAKVYASWAAPVGQAPAQAPQSMQVAGSILKMSPSLMESVGHSPWQAPHAMH